MLFIVKDFRILNPLNPSEFGMRSLFYSVVLLFIFSISASAQIDYNSEIQPIFNNSCTSCHGGTSGVTLSSYSATMNSTGSQYGIKIVIAGNADGSPLVDKIEPNPTHGSQMPTNGTLSSDEITKIRQWIAQGANEVATSNEEEELQSPTDYSLLGNYPNPFNPSTTIQLRLKESAEYRVSIYNVNGQRVASMLGRASAGTQQLNVNLAEQPSGIYIYRVRVMQGNKSVFIGSGKMTLVK